MADIFYDEMNSFINDLFLSFRRAYALPNLLWRRITHRTLPDMSFSGQEAEIIEKAIRKHFGDTVIMQERNLAGPFVEQAVQILMVLFQLASRTRIKPEQVSYYYFGFFLILANYYLYENVSDLAIKSPQSYLYRPINNDFKNMEPLPYKNTYDMLSVEIKERIESYYAQFKDQPSVPIILDSLCNYIPPKLIGWLRPQTTSSRTQIKDF